VFRATTQRGFLVLLAFVVTLSAVACGSSDDGDDAQPERGDPNKFVIWAIDDFKKPVEATVAKFQNHQPQIEIETVFLTGPELRDKLLVGERPDLYLGTERELANLEDENLLPGEKAVDFGVNTMELVVAAGNPTGVVDLSVFGTDPRRSGLCERELACGRTAIELLERALVDPAPDLSGAPKELLAGVTGGSLDATLLFRTQTVRARRDGLVEYVPIPPNLRIEVAYKFDVVRPGDATDLFVKYLGQSNTLVNVLAQAGLAPLGDDPA
jgi:molybdate transport system substrate-binding protein